MAFVIVSDAARAKAFYGESLGLKFVSQDEYAVTFDANGVLVRATVMPGYKATDHPVLGWTVPDIARAAADLASAGVTLERYSFLEQDELGVWSAPDGKAKVAWFKDPDGNVLSIAQD